MCWAEGHEVILSTMVRILGTSFGTLGAFPWTVHSWAVSVEPVVAGPFRKKVGQGVHALWVSEEGT